MISRKNHASGWTRRQLLTMTGILAAVPVAGCDALSTSPTGEDESGGGGSNAPKGKEAPALAEAVKAGDLPPLADRLPEAPMVVEPRDEIGRYGGELNLITLDIGGGDYLNTWIGYENLVCWRPGAQQLTTDQIIPNVAEEFEVNDDGTEYTFRLRKGLRWSDGEPFTADDIMFWYEDVLLNEELSPGGLPDYLDTGGDKPLVVEKADDETVIFKFSAPAGIFLIKIAAQHGGAMTGYPRHYMEQFHKNYADDIDRVVSDAGFDNWMDLFANRNSLWENPELPTLHAWTMTAPFSVNTERVVAERNPYYWKTDPDGSQLPYIDKVVFALANDEESGVLRITNGEVDIMERNLNDLRNKPIYAENRERGGYEFFDTIPQQMNRAVFMLNLTHKDPGLRRVFQNKDFRIGLSHAINRQEIIDTVFLRQGEPWQAAPRRISGYYNERLAKQYTEYDPDKANQYLDKVLPDKDEQGRRLLPTGEPISINIDASLSEPDWIDSAEMVKEHWREVGVETRVKSEDHSLWFERIDANEHDACVGHGGGGLSPMQTAFYYVPTNFNTRYGVPWYRWVQNPDDGLAEKPPPETLRQIELYAQLVRTADKDDQDELMNEILDGAADQFYAMGIVQRERDYGVVSKKLRNRPELSLTGWNHAHLAPENPQQFFFIDA